MKFKYMLTAAMAVMLLMLAAGSAQARDREHRRDYCREYTKTIRIGGDMRVGYGTACRQPDGAWTIVSTRGSLDPYIMSDHIYKALMRRDRDAVVVSDHDDRRHYSYGRHKAHHKKHHKKKRYGYSHQGPHHKCGGHSRDVYSRF